jgi:outer membrane protein
MRLVFIAFSFLTCFLSQTTKAQNSSKWDLRRCVEYAMTNNISVRQADVQARLSAITLKQSKLQQIPSLNFQGSNGFQFGNTVDPTTNIRTDRSSMYQQFNLSAQANSLTGIVRKIQSRQTTCIIRQTKQHLKKRRTILR